MVGTLAAVPGLFAAAHGSTMADPTISYGSVLVVSAVALAAPLLVNLAPKLRMPAVAAEIVIGVLVGPSVLDWVHIDVPLTILSLLGLGFLLFLAGLEIDPAQLRGRVGVIAGAFLASLVLATIAGHLFGLVESVSKPLFVAIALSSTSLGLVVPVLRDAGENESEFGQTVLAASSLAEFGTILLVSLLYSQESTTTESQVLLLVLFVVAVGVMAFGLVRAGRSMRVSRTLLKLEDTSSQLGVRVAMVLLILFVALAGELGLETILGAFIAGAILRIADPQHHLTHVEFKRKVEAIGYGFLVPIFFVTSGVRFDVEAMVKSPSHFMLVPLYLLALLMVRGVPAIAYRRFFPTRQVIAAGLLQATSLTFIVISARLGVELNIIDEGSGAALVVAGLLSVVVFPPIALALLGDRQDVTEDEEEDEPA